MSTPRSISIGPGSAHHLFRVAVLYDDGSVLVKTASDNPQFASEERPWVKLEPLPDPAPAA